MFRFDGRQVPCKEGDTIAAALHREGILEISRSMKYHRPRGVYCNTGSCAGCFVAADGVPNVPACMTSADAVRDVQSQNRMGSAKRDLLGVTDMVYRTGFDPHGAFTRPRFLNAAFMKAVRFMSGVGQVPSGGLPAPTHYQEHDVDEIIIGAGRHGLARARDAAADGRQILLVDELGSPGGSALWDASERDTRELAGQAASWPGVTPWTDAVAFGIYDDTVAVAKDGDLHAVRPGRITIAAGRHDGWPLFENNDLPGVMSLRGARRMMGQHRVAPGRRVVLHQAHPEGRRGAWADDLAALGGEVVASGSVDAVRGGTRVEKARIDGTWVACDAVVCDVPGTPRIELLQQAGCELAFQDGVLAPVVDASGRTSRDDVHWLGGTS